MLSSELNVPRIDIPAKPIYTWHRKIRKPRWIHNAKRLKIYLLQDTVEVQSNWTLKANFDNQSRSNRSIVRHGIYEWKGNVCIIIYSEWPTYSSTSYCHAVIHEVCLLFTRWLILEFKPEAASYVQVLCSATVPRVHDSNYPPILLSLCGWVPVRKSWNVYVCIQCWLERR